MKKSAHWILCLLSAKPLSYKIRWLLGRKQYRFLANVSKTKTKRRQRCIWRQFLMANFTYLETFSHIKIARKSACFWVEIHQTHKIMGKITIFVKFLLYFAQLSRHSTSRNKVLGNDKLTAGTDMKWSTVSMILSVRCLGKMLSPA